ncbi:lanthionine synthetase C family protein [Streptomyces jumonjinensis]|uniref:Lanthionine synthetase n=1 Tax=Streptomyces jumonjinensis TaxID=1945 RepID=A0A646KS54_STRJU|nr:lanthionine synthetase C family protein [Streptomyces jumonjinensis]MQT05083.1 lanthionine synthetase [Streptomyces jumonjinensis]
MTPEEAMAVADRLARPDAPHLPSNEAWWAQSLAHGAPGIALLHIELAAAGLRPWRRAQDWLSVAAASPITSGSGTALFYGAPAVAYALAATAAVRPAAYRSALEALDTQIAVDAHRRVMAANARIHAGLLPELAEFDAIRGLAGIGAYLLWRDPGGSAVRAVLDYLVRLVDPLSADGIPVPGWWTDTGPTGRPDDEFPGGHGNAGMAHGISGPLALLALAARQEITVPGQLDAIASICAWLDSWRIETEAGSRWPYMITREELAVRATHPHHSGARRRPSWCYGTAGLARAQQLAALVSGDSERSRIAEEALVGALTDPAQLSATTDGSLCHGFAGLARITARASADATEPIAAQLRALIPGLLAAMGRPTDRESPGLLEGAAGTALAALAPAGEPTPSSTWDTCLLIT